MNAIIIIDLQNCFINKNTEKLPLKIKNYLKQKKHDYIIFFKFKNSINSNFVKKLKWKKSFKSPEVDIVSELENIALKNYVFIKNTYSIFKAKGSLDFLKKHKISKLYFCGLDSDSCILASAFEAFDLGFDFEIIKKLTLSYGGINQKIINKIIKRNFNS